MDPSQVSWIAVIAAALAAFAVGGLWYSPLLFHRVWLRETGLSEDALKAGAARPFIVCFAASLVMSVNLAFFLGPTATAGFGAAAGFAAGFGWVGMGMATTFAFERRSLKLTLVDAGYHVVTLTLMGTILGASKM